MCSARRICTGLTVLHLRLADSDPQRLPVRRLRHGVEHTCDEGPAAVGLDDLDLECRPQLSDGDVTIRGGLADSLLQALTLPHLIVPPLC